MVIGNPQIRQKFSPSKVCRMTWSETKILRFGKGDFNLFFWMKCIYKYLLIQLTMLPVVSLVFRDFDFKNAKRFEDFTGACMRQSLDLLS